MRSRDNITAKTQSGSRGPTLEQVPSYGDKRQMAQCVYCGGPRETGDHVPSRILLDEPYPENLPVLPACRFCNDSFSKDEEYVACLVECAVSGFTHSNRVGREKIARILGAKLALAARLEAGRLEAGGANRIHVEADRVRRVALKLARGHAAFELNEPQLGQPVEMVIAPLPGTPEEDLKRFETAPPFSLWPEVGSRAMLALVENGPAAARWIVVQAGRYRYLAVTEDAGVLVRFVLSEYLGCEVRWA